MAITLLNKFPNKLNVLNQNGLNLLHFACLYGSVEFVKYVFENENFHIDVDVVDSHGLRQLSSLMWRQP